MCVDFSIFQFQFLSNDYNILAQMSLNIRHVYRLHQPMVPVKMQLTSLILCTSFLLYDKIVPGVYCLKYSYNETGKRSERRH